MNVSAPQRGVDCRPLETAGLPPQFRQGLTEADRNTLPDEVLAMLVELEELGLLRRLEGLKQMFTCYYAWDGDRSPDFGHNRLQHSIDVALQSYELLASLGVAPYIIKVGCAAGLLHDVGHTAASHEGERLLREQEVFFDHDLNGVSLVAIDQVVEVLKKHGVEWLDVMACLTGKKITLDLLRDANPAHSAIFENAQRAMQLPDWEEKSLQWHLVHTLVQDFSDMLSYLERDYASASNLPAEQALVRQVAKDFVGSLVVTGRGEVGLRSLGPAMDLAELRAKLYATYPCGPEATVTGALLEIAFRRCDAAPHQIIWGDDLAVLNGFNQEHLKIFSEGTRQHFPVAGIVGFEREVPWQQRRGILSNVAREIRDRLQREDNLHHGEDVVVAVTPDFSRRYKFFLISDREHGPEERSIEARNGNGYSISVEVDGVENTLVVKSDQVIVIAFNRNIGVPERWEEKVRTIIDDLNSKGLYSVRYAHDSRG